MQEQQPAASLARRLGLEAAIGAALGFVASSLGGPAVISWWYEPPSKDAFSCAGSVRTALSQFVVMQLICAVVGGAALAALLFLSRRFLKRRQARSAGAV